MRKLKFKKIKPKRFAEGLSPIYKDGRITPGTRGLGPEYLKDVKWEKMLPSKKIVPIKKPKQPRIHNIRHLV